MPGKDCGTRSNGSDGRSARAGRYPSVPPVPTAAAHDEIDAPRHVPAAAGMGQAVNTIPIGRPRQGANWSQLQFT